MGNCTPLRMPSTWRDLLPRRTSLYDRISSPPDNAPDPPLRYSRALWRWEIARRFGCQVLGEICFRAALLFTIEFRRRLITHQIRRFDIRVRFGDGKLHAASDAKYLARFASAPHFSLRSNFVAA